MMKPLIDLIDVRLNALIGMLPASLSPIMQAATFLGNPVTVLSLIGILALLGGYLHRFRLSFAAIGVALWIGVDSLIKILVHRHRPPTEYVAHMMLKTYSFPSGHACGSMLGYGLLAYLSWKLLPAPFNIIIPSVLAFLILLVGVSRVYLGAHYPTDVIGGWLIGAIGLGLIIWLIRPLV